MNVQSKRKRVIMDDSDDDDSDVEEYKTIAKKRRYVIEDSDDDSDDEDRKRFLGSDTDVSGGEEDDNMDDFIVEDDGGNGEAKEELDKLLATCKKKRKEAHETFVQAEEKEAAKNNPPSRKQVEYLKSLCRRHKKAIPPLEQLCKKKISILINTLLMQQWSKWKYGDAVESLTKQPAERTKKVQYPRYAPKSILEIEDRIKRLKALYSFWTKARPDMLPFDDVTVDKLREKSTVRMWTSRDLWSAKLLANTRNVTYSDEYIMSHLKRTFSTASEDDIRLGLAKCRRNLILMTEPNPNPTGQFYL